MNFTMLNLFTYVHKYRTTLGELAGSRARFDTTITGYTRKNVLDSWNRTKHHVIGLHNLSDRSKAIVVCKHGLKQNYKLLTTWR